jgi:hypothetical protein
MRSGTPDSCGCALSAKFLAVALLASGAYYGWQFSKNELSLGGLGGRVALVTFVAAGVGKVIGIFRHRWRGKAPFQKAR